MKTEVQAYGNVTVIAAHGPLVAEESVDLKRAVENSLTAGSQRLVLNLADVPYLDSTGIELLLELCHAGLAPRRRPKVAALSETCLEALELTDVLPRLEVFDTVDNAVRSSKR